MRRPFRFNALWIAFALFVAWICMPRGATLPEPQKTTAPPAPVITRLIAVLPNRTPPSLCVSADLPPLMTDAPGAFTIIALPPNFEANAVNNKGEVVGTWDTYQGENIADGVSNAAIWYRGKVRLIPRLGDASQCAGICLSDNGWLGGSAGNTYIDPVENPSYAVVWKASAIKNPVRWQGQLPSLSSDSVLSVNRRGQAVGTASASCTGEMQLVADGPVPYRSESHASFWDGQKMQDLGEGEACGINENGQIVGTQNKNIVLWQNGSAYRLGEGKATAINNRAQIVGKSPFGSAEAEESDTASHSFHAMLWEKGALKDLGTLIDNWNSAAAAINDRGQVVGNSAYKGDYNRPGDARAFLWQAGKMHDLNTLISKHSGWVLYDARSINNKGWIVGMGTLRGETCSFLLIPK